MKSFFKREQHTRLLMKYLIFINEYYLFKFKVGFKIASMQMCVGVNVSCNPYAYQVNCIGIGGVVMVFMMCLQYGGCHKKIFCKSFFIAQLLQKL